MMYVFIDTNIFLNFYGYSKDHLDKLEKLLDLISDGRITLFLTQQVVDEFTRRRENRLYEVLKNIEAFSTKLESSVICHSMPEMKDLQNIINDAESAKKKLQNSLVKQIKEKKLYADKIITDIFNACSPYEITEDIHEKAQKRMTIGNPPGKAGSYGDAINWECLIEATSARTDLYFIGGDGDFLSIIDKGFSPFLIDEWERTNGGCIYYYPLISEFLKEHFSEAKITQENIKEEKKETRKFIDPWGIGYGPSAYLDEFGKLYTVNQQYLEMIDTFAKASAQVEKLASGYVLPTFRNINFHQLNEAAKIIKEATDGIGVQRFR